MYAQYFMHGSCYRSQNLSSQCLPYPTNSLGKPGFVQSGFDTCSTMTKEPNVFFLLLPIYSIGEMQFIPQSHCNGWWVMNAFVWPSAELTECWILYLNVTKEENCTAQSGCSESHACHILHLKWICAWPSRTNLCDRHWPILKFTLVGLGEAGSSQEKKARTARAWCHFAPGQCNTSSPSWCTKSGASLGQGGVGTSTLLSRYHHMWLLVFGWCERTSVR